jgi:hypothetical protein
MELKLRIGYQELLALIKQLPMNQVKRLKEDLALLSAEGEEEYSLKDFRSFLLGGPIMDDDQYQSYLSNRQHFKAWRAN